ncbi:ead/Ea22-like family protein [Salmonella enterica subsp. enterica]|nr:ead/Ea22-like family protein [Salmonella enterica]EEN1713441.1 ead/Ea22-like family protein [Salmonella enterica subsp. enterica]EGT2409447.1 ead/Ea22-like family protein [Salmonella enterica subsp. enterica serovar Newport]EDK8262931.1 ead/Ea22-like family protein [Salmonella enterica]EEI6057108.1 ead/Ea22-like family protein [Salmonella enterica]
MTKINYQALREAAERAIPAMECLLMLPVDDDLISEQELKDYGVDIDALNAFKFLTGPETVLALLDERERNQQYIKRRDQENEDIALTVGKLRVELEHYKSREERVTKLVLDNSTSWDVLYEKLEAAERRIAELEKGHQEAAKQINSWRRLAKQNIAERGKDISELEAARQRIQELEARVIVLPQRLSPEGYHIDEAYMVDDTEGEYLDRDAVIDAIRAAGIKVKGE